MTASPGGPELPPGQAESLRRAKRLEWVTIGFLTVAVIMVCLVLGNSQAMKAAWIEDMLSFLPPPAFLVAVRMVRRPASAERPYGWYRSIGVAHLVAAVALVTMGSYLVVDSTIVLVTAEHPPIGSVTLLGQTFWLGWLMIAAMVLTGVPPVFLGRAKMKLAEELHDKVLYADAAMNKADWMTALGSIIGVTGIGFGLWWADATAARFIASSILADGIRNTRAAVTDLTDDRATTYDDKRPHPLIGEVDARLRALGWVADAASRVRDEGHIFHVESFLVPEASAEVSVARLEQARAELMALDWKLRDVVPVPVAELPNDIRLPR